MILLKKQRKKSDSLISAALSTQYSIVTVPGNGHLLCAIATTRSVFHTVHIWLAGKKRCRRDRSELNLTLHCAMAYPNVESVLIAASLRQIAWALMEKAVWILPNVWAAAFVLPPALLAHAYLRPDRTTIMPEQAKKEAKNIWQLVFAFVKWLLIAGITGAVGGAIGGAFNISVAMLARGELHCIGATTLDEYRKYIEKDAALERRFQPVQVDEPSVEDTISILRGLKERYEVYHGVRIHDNALVAAATLSDRYISDRFLPDKAIDLVDEACALIRTEMDSMPAEMDDMRRKIMQLEIEEMALKKEDDQFSKDRLQKLTRELADLKDKFNAMTRCGLIICRQPNS